jgi:hypothetical protein
LNALPNGRLPHVPLLGNGHLGVALNAGTTNTNATAPITFGPGRNNTLDAWINTNSMWSCGACAAPGPASGCCVKIALGGVSLSFAPTFPEAAPLPSFAAQQRIGDAQLATTWRTPAGSSIVTVTYMHPERDVVVTNVTWLPRAGGDDPAELVLEAQTWVFGANAAVPGHPAPVTIGCAARDGAALPACPGLLAYVSRTSATIADAPHTVWTALATGVTGSGVSLRSSKVAATNAPVWAVAQTVSVAAGATAVFVTAAAHSSVSGGSPAADPTAAALAAAAAVLGARAGAADVQADADAWWTTFWARSSVSLPSQPLVEEMWYGAQYILAASASTNASVPAPALYGPWVTMDQPAWNGAC